MGEWPDLIGFDGDWGGSGDLESDVAGVVDVCAGSVSARALALVDRSGNVLHVSVVDTAVQTALDVGLKHLLDVREAENADGRAVSGSG